MSRCGQLAYFVVLGAALGATSVSAGVPIDTSAFRNDGPVRVETREASLLIHWPIDDRSQARLEINSSGNGRLLKSLSLERGGQAGSPLLAECDPAVFITVGKRVTPGGKPADNPWQVFFDNPHRRPHQTHVGKLSVERMRVASSATRATLTIDSVEVGPFRGSLECTVYAGSPLIRWEFVVQTTEDQLAIFYDAGLLSDRAQGERMVWKDTEDRWQSVRPDEQASPRPLAVRYRTLACQSPAGSVACFPPPHQFMFPRDWTDNLRYVWYGRNYHGSTSDFGFGIRQNKDGGGNFVPWFNAPPNVAHRLAMWLYVTGSDGQRAVEEALRYTRGDRFAELPGFLTMTSHYHMAIAVKAMEERNKGIERTEPPAYVTMFKQMGVNMVHLGEFHGDGHQQDPGPLRFPEMESMFRECRRWSDEQLLLIPGEELNTFLGLQLEGKHPGHWMSLFPRPVYWSLKRGENEPFVSEVEPYGKVYRVGGRADMIRLIKEEGALVWAAHPRIKASSWTPDIFRNEDFFLADYWLGGAWKSMPGDLSRERLGERVLDLLDDMANWGQRKYVLGEVDVFKLDPTHELFGHMNVNYVQMDRLPRYDEGWQPLLDTLRAGRFFVTTGEVLLPSFTVEGKSSGEAVSVAKPESVPVKFDVRWTFPLAFAELISGDGQRVYRQRLDLTDTGSFGERAVQVNADLRGRRWVRLEVWDVAANGAFTQPVWLY